jgi:hypothetical protein
MKRLGTGQVIILAALIVILIITAVWVTSVWNAAGAVMTRLPIPSDGESRQRTDYLSFGALEPFRHTLRLVGGGIVAEGYLRTSGYQRCLPRVALVQLRK